MMTPYIRKIVFYKLYIWHLFLDFFSCSFFSSFFLFPFFFSYKIVQNYSALIDFADPNKKLVYLTVLFIHWKQFGTLGFCIDGKASHFLLFCISIDSLKH